MADAGLARLQDLPGLGRVNVTGTKITDKGVDDLKQKLPNCTVEKQNERRNAGIRYRT